MPRVNYYTNCTRVLGPGNRFAIWFQGCKQRCKACINPAGQNMDGGFYISVDDLLQEILASKNIDGVTISGGEPFLQFEELNLLVQKIKEQTTLDVMLYSGYKYEDLLQKFGETFFELIDIFIDGEYIEEQNNNSPYKGSDNQRIFFPSGKDNYYKKLLQEKNNREIEFEINKNSEVFLVGIPPKNFYENLITEIIKHKE